MTDFQDLNPKEQIIVANIENLYLTHPTIKKKDFAKAIKFLKQKYS